MRKKIVGSSWKMHINSLQEGERLAKGITAALAPLTCDIEVFILPPFPMIQPLSALFRNTPVKWGAQNVAYLEKGALTGEVPPDLLTELECSYVEVGHAERRQYFSESDTIVNKKVKLCLQYNLVPVICIGELAEDLKNKNAKVRLHSQILWAIDGIPEEQLQRVIFAYEPVWAIGKEKAADKSYVEEMHGYIRTVVAQNFGSETGEKIRIIYGGSVSPQFAYDISQSKYVDGVFIGRYGLNAENFAAMVTAFNNL